MPPSPRRSNARLSRRGFPLCPGSLRLTAAPLPRYNCRLCRNAWSSTFRARSASSASPCHGR
ncbi:hypothetical protein BN844_1562 [Pseudomonas sp. SHC52]|nr:hypothetical protein BN844_1562 [Pseudomonas sp. SHC52]